MHQNAHHQSSPRCVRFMTKDEVHAQVVRFRGKIAEGFLTNYYQQPLYADRLPAVLTDGMFAFLDSESFFDRLYFYAAPDSASFEDLLADTTVRTVVLNYVGKGHPEQIEALALRSGFYHHARYHRYAGYYSYRPGCPPSPLMAHPAEIGELHAALLSDCDVFCDHPPEKAKLAELMAQGQVLVSRRQGLISGYFIYQVMGMKGYMNYWFSRDKTDHLSNIHLLLAFYQEMSQRNIKYVFAWVNSQNANIISIHKKFGLSFDGLSDDIYVRNQP